MFTHPVITAALADQHHQDLIARANTYRLARAARDSQPTRPGRSPQPRRLTGPVRAIRRAATAIAAGAAAAVLTMTAAGATPTPHVSAHFVVHSRAHSGDGQLGRRWA
jgi:hypothetical protein